MAETILKLAGIAGHVPGFRRVMLGVARPLGQSRFRAAYRKANEAGQVWLHVGAGTVQLDGWLNTDISPRCPLYLNAMSHLPIKDDTVAYIFGEQFINNLPREGALAFFKECFRVLRHDGVLRMTTIDTEALARAYLDDPDLVRRLNERNKRRGYEFTQYPLDILNKTFFEDDNLCEYDNQMLQHMFGEAGFKKIARCKVGESPHPALSRIERHDLGSILDQFTFALEGTK